MLETEKQRVAVNKEASSFHSKPSSTVKPKRDMGPLIHFEELIKDESELKADVSFSKPQEFSNNVVVDDCTLPDPRALLHVTNRRKVPHKKKSFVVNDELAEMQAQYEYLLLESETQKTVFVAQIDCLMKKLAEANLKYNCHTMHNLDTIANHEDNGKSDSEAMLVIKQLQDKINILEMEKIESQKNLDHIAELGTEQDIRATMKYAEEWNLDLLIKLLTEIQEIISGVQNCGGLVENISSLLDELFRSSSSIRSFIRDLNSVAGQNFVQLKSIINDHDKLQLYMQQKVTQLENEKAHLHDQSVDIQRQMEEMRLHIQNSEQALRELSEHHDLEKSELFSQITVLEKEISRLSSNSLAKEKEILRRDLEKTKVKLKDTDFKLKNAIQEKTKLEGEKACAEQEAKQLHNQRILLERDMNKRISFSSRRRDSSLEKSSRASELKKSKGHAVPFEPTIVEENKKLEVLTFEMEATIASLEAELNAVYEEKEEDVSRNEILASELVALSDKLSIANSELDVLKGEVSVLKVRLEESESRNQKWESSINLLEGEKEELAMQLSNALLEMEEEKAIWSAKEKASVVAIEEKAKSFNAEMSLLAKELCEVKNELKCSRDQCKIFDERLAFSEENLAKENKRSTVKSLEIESLREHLQGAYEVNKRSQEEIVVLTREREKLIADIEQKRGATDVKNLKNHETEMLEAKAQVEQLIQKILKMEIEMHNVEVSKSKEKAKMRMRLHWTQVKAEAFCRRQKEAMDELNYMHKRYEEASGKLKNRLASYGIEVLNLKQQLAAVQDPK